MDKRKRASSTKPMRRSERATALVISKINLTPIIPEEVLTSRFSSVDRTEPLVFKSKTKLPQFSPQNAVKRTTSIEGKGALPFKSNISTRADNRVIRSKIKVTPNLPKIVTSKDVSNMPKKTPVIPSITATQALTDMIILEAEHTMNSSRNRLVHNFRLIWLHSDIIKFNANGEQSISKFRQVIDAIDIFTSPKTCIEFLQTKTDEILFIILSNDLVQSTIPLIHNMFQIHHIFILCENESTHKISIENWEKIEGIFTSIDSICQILDREISQYHHDSPTIRITNIDLISLDPSFICTRLLKEIIAQMHFDNKAKNEFIQLYHQKYHIDNYIINEMESNYHMHTPIWWYTRDSSLSNMISQAFKLLDINAIIKMGFFIQDLHQQITNEYKPLSEKLMFYRGQRLSCADFEQLRMMKGGLFLFNSFFLTTIDKKIALSCADNFRDYPDMIGIIFQITVDPMTLNSIPFISLDNESYHSDSKGEFIFTIFTIFRVGQMKQLDDRFWQVELSLTTDNDNSIRQLNEYIWQGTQGSIEWDRLGRLLLTTGQFDKAENVFQILIENSPKNDLKGLADRFHQMGLVKTQTGFYKKAIIYFDDAIKMYEKCINANFFDFSTIYNDIGLLYQQTEDYEKALKSYQMVLNVEKQLNFLNYSNLAIIYGNIAQVNKNLKQYSTALQVYQIILKIHKKCIPLNFQYLSTAYRNIAEMHCCMEEYSQALEIYKKMRDIQENYLPQNDINMATIESNIGQMYQRTGNVSKTSEHYENARKCCQMILQYIPQNVTDRAIIYSNIASVYKNISDYSEALEFYRKTVKILLDFPHMKKPDLAATYDNIGQIYQNMYNQKSAYIFYMQAIRIAQQRSPPDLSQLQLYKSHCAEVSSLYFTMSFGLVGWKFTEEKSLIPI